VALFRERLHVPESFIYVQAVIDGHDLFRHRVAYWYLPQRLPLRLRQVYALSPPFDNTGNKTTTAFQK
jgi:hypothetical protein